MIAAYAQATDRQGVDAAVNGKVVSSDEADFAELRERSGSLNFATTPHRVGDVEARYGRRLVRLEFMGPDGGELNSSPIIVVADASELEQDREDIVRRAIESIAAIGRECDVQVVETGFAVGERLYRSARTKRRVATAVSAALVAAAIVSVARGCATLDVSSSAHYWSR